MATILYARVSTDEQTTAHQRTQAEQAGFAIDKVVADNGVSGVSTNLRERPEGKRLFDILRRGDTLVVRWVDRLGRNYEDITDTIREFMRLGVIVRTVFGNFTFDGATTDATAKAVRDTLIAFMAATAQAQAEAAKHAQRAGIAHAKANKATAYLGRKPSFNRAQLATVHAMTGTAGASAIAKAAGISRNTVYRIQANPAGAEAALASWEALAAR